MSTDSVDIELHIFKNGFGSQDLVPAHRHRNPDGTIGGWVAETAEVGRDVYIDESSEVHGRAVVSGDVRICEDSSVCSGAEVGGKGVLVQRSYVGGFSRVRGPCEIRGSSRVLDHAVVGGGSCLRGTNVTGFAAVEGSTLVMTSVGEHVSVTRSDMVRCRLGGRIAYEGCHYEGCELVGVGGGTLVGGKGEIDRYDKRETRVVRGGSGVGEIYSDARGLARGVNREREYSVHPNGGGLVAPSAKVDPLSFVDEDVVVGPHCTVEGRGTRLSGGGCFSSCRIKDAVINGRVYATASELISSEIRWGEGERHMLRISKSDIRESRLGRCGDHALDRTQIEGTRMCDSQISAAGELDISGFDCEGVLAPHIEQSRLAHSSLKDVRVGKGASLNLSRGAHMSNVEVGMSLNVMVGLQVCIFDSWLRGEGSGFRVEGIGTEIRNAGVIVADGHVAKVDADMCSLENGEFTLTGGVIDGWSYGDLVHESQDRELAQTR